MTLRARFPPRRWPHVLVIGGTGMLAEASQWLADRADRFSLLACSDASLAAVKQRLPTSLPVLTMAIDYRQEVDFSQAIHACIAQAGVPQLVLGWFHGERAPWLAANRLSGQGSTTSFFHVLGSASANPAVSLQAQRSSFDALPCVDYHQVVLGFVRGEHASRWLTNAEISAGVIAAIQLESPCHVVGVVEPWSERP